jgi:hypothetical protein
MLKYFAGQKVKITRNKQNHLVGVKIFCRAENEKMNIKRNK